MAKNVIKPVYFNPENPRELELVVWIDNKFSSFGGLVKDLLYKEMKKEQGYIQEVNVPTVIESCKQDEDIVSTEIHDYDVTDFIDKNEIDECDC